MALLAILLLLQDPAERFRADDPAIREAAERELVHMGDAGAAILEGLVDDPDIDVAVRARRAIEQNRRVRAVSPSLAKRVPGTLARDWTLEELLALPLEPDEEAWFAPKVARRRDLRPSTWFRIVLGRIPPAELADAVRRGPNAVLRAYALAALQKADAAQAGLLAVDLLRSPEAELRIQAAFALGAAGSPVPAGHLTRLLRESGPAARAAEWAIRRLVPGADVPRRAPPAPAASRLDQLAAFAALVDGRPPAGPVRIADFPAGTRLARAGVGWSDLVDGLALEEPEKEGGSWRPSGWTAVWKGPLEIGFARSSR